MSYAPPPPMYASGPQGSPIPPINGAATIRLEVISEAFDIIKSNFGPWAIVTLLYIGGAFVSQMLTSIPSTILQSLLGIQQPAPGQPPDMSILLPQILVSLPFGVINQMLIYMVLGAVIKIAIHYLRTAEVDFSQAFRIMDNALQLGIAAVVVSLSVFIGSLLCCVPGLVLNGLFLLALPLVVDQNCNAIDAIKASFGAMKDHVLMATLAAFLVPLVSGLGICLCCIGYFFTGAILPLAFALIYRDFFPQLFMQQEPVYAQPQTPFVQQGPPPTSWPPPPPPAAPQQ